MREGEEEVARREGGKVENKHEARVSSRSLPSLFVA